jgi:hypothetical protein
VAEVDFEHSLWQSVGMARDLSTTPDLANVFMKDFGSVDETNQDRGRSHWGIIFTLTLCMFSLISVNAFAAGGTCPSNVPATNCYFIAATGSDANNGTSESAPWLHAPGMPNCTSKCALVAPAAGQGFIFRGGDTWHFGNSSASPYTGGTWTWQWNGTTVNPIYIGVDQTWFTGGSWSRPILTGDNPLTPNPGVPGDSVTSCAHQIASSNTMWFAQVTSHYILDNFEMTGICNNTPGQVNHQDDYIDNNASQNTLIENIYIHGWSHVPLGGTMQVNVKAIEGGSAGMGQDQQVGERFSYIVVDGADSDPAGAEANQFDGWYDVEFSVFRYLTQALPMLAHTIHDTLFENWYWSPNAGHQNLLEFNGSEWDGAINVFYNNVFRHIYVGGSGGNVGIWPEPGTSTTDYWFNNLIYDDTGGAFNVGQNDRDQGPLLIFNNTWESADNQSLLNFLCTHSHPFTTTNNHYVVNGSPYSGGSCQGTYVTDLAMTHALATADGYTAGETFAYSPPSSGSPTVGTGTNRQPYCTTLLASSDPQVHTAGIACTNDTTYACAYNTSSHTVTCPARTPVARPTSGAWDIGAYEFLVADPPAPPTSLVATPQ